MNEFQFYEPIFRALSAVKDNLKFDIDGIQKKWKEEINVKNNCDVDDMYRVFLEVSSN